MESSFKQKLNTLNMVYFMQPLMLLGFSIVAYYINATNPQGNPGDFPTYFIYIPFILLIICFPISNFAFRMYLQSNLKNDMDTNKKISIYQTATLVRGAVLEVAGLFGVVFSFIAGQSEILGVTALVIILFLITRPTPFKIRQTLGLSRDDVK